MLETLGYTIRIGSTPTFLYFDLRFVSTLPTQHTTFIVPLYIYLWDLHFYTIVRLNSPSCSYIRPSDVLWSKCRGGHQGNVVLQRQKASTSITQACFRERFLFSSTSLLPLVGAQSAASSLVFLDYSRVFFLTLSVCPYMLSAYGT